MNELQQMRRDIQALQASHIRNAELLGRVAAVIAAWSRDKFPVRQEFRFGDVIEVISTEKSMTPERHYFAVGDKARVIEVGENSVCADFTGSGNRSVLGDGRWYVDKEECRVVG